MKGKRLFYIVFLFIATAVVVAMGVNLGMKASKLVSNDEKSIKENDKNLKTEEITNDFKVEYKEEVYTLKNKKGVVMIENKRTIPIITSEKYSNQAELISNSLVDYSNIVWNDIRRTSDLTVEELEKKVGVNYILSVVEQNDKYFSFVFDLSGSLGEFSRNNRDAYTYNVSTGELLTFESITTNEQQLIDKCYEILSSYISQQEYNDDLDEEWHDNLKKLINKSGVWYLTKDGIAFAFPKYSLGAGYIGVISYTVPYDDLNNLVLDEYKNA